MDSPGEVGFSAERLGRLSELLSSYVEREEIAGLLASVHRHGHEVAHVRVGWADIEARRAMQDDAIMRIMSMTKPVTALAAMMLYEEGRFDLNTRVSELVPAFRELKVCAGERSDGSLDLVPVERPLTFRHLFTHSGGMSYGGDEKDAVDREYRKAMQRYGDQQQELSLPSLLDEMPRLPLAFQPGSGYRYSMSVDVLGALVELMSGISFGEYLKERVFAPLGMVDTAFYVPANKLGRVPTLYERRTGDAHLKRVDELPPTQPPAYLSPGGGLFSTIRDYGRFCQMFLNGGELDGVRLLSPTTVSLFRMNHMPEEALRDMWAQDPETAGFGCSLGNRALMDVSQTGRYGSTGEFGWEGAFSTYFWVDCHEDVFGLLMAQHVPISFPLFRKFKQLTYQAMV